MKWVKTIPSKWNHWRLNLYLWSPWSFISTKMLFHRIYQWNSLQVSNEAQFLTKFNSYRSFKYRGIPNNLHHFVLLEKHHEQKVCHWSHWNMLKTHWGRVTHICVSKLTPLFQIMTCRLAGAEPLSESMLDWILLIGPFETNINEHLIDMYTY